MPYDVNWYVPEQVVYANFWGEVTLADFRKFNGEMMTLLEAPGGRVHVIVNAVQVTSVSASPQDIVAALPYLRHSRIGWGAIVQNNVFTRFMVSMVAQLMQVRTRFFSDLPAAVAFLEQIDETIRWERVKMNQGL
jgi:hypothetical protein